MLTELRNLVFINFYGLSIFIGSMFFFLVSFFIFFTIKNKSKATFHVAVMYLYSGLLAVAYIPAFSIYDPLAAYHRWLTVPAALLTHPHFAQLFYHFPETRYPKTAKVILIIQYSITAIIVGVFFAVTLNRETVYSFRGHFWDFDADDVSQLVAVGILLNIAHLLVAGLWHTVVHRGRRLVIFGMWLSMLFAVLLPSITNVLSRDGLISRDIHQTTIVLMSITGLFAMLILYLNNTKDQATFMGKIMGVSLVTFMVVLVFICYYSFEDQEIAYDAIHKEQTSRLAIERDYPVGDLEYLTRYDVSKGTFNLYRGQQKASAVKFGNLKNEFANTAIYEGILALQGDDWRDTLRTNLESAPLYFAGYRGLLLREAPSCATPAALMAKIEGRKQQFLYRHSKLSALPVKSYRAAAQKYLASMPADLAPFREAISEHMKKHQDLEGAALRQEILLYFSPFHRHGTRFYRTGEKSQHFTAFMQVSRGGQHVYEAGYSYVAYRQLMTRVGIKLFLIFLAIVVIVVVGFRIFFLGTLVRPLDSLLAGVSQVNDGDLKVEIPVTVSDEIGFLTRSFNAMVASIRTARAKLEEYANELEQRVRERTAALQETLDKVQQLKDQQDGDYFLTSLLIKPLASNSTKSETVQTDYYMQQKKRFSFRKWEEEIGGDFCSAHSITLRDKPHTVFLNADAMGKSIQGAGGALVLGAVFESLMERTKLMSQLKEQSPERWIKNAFQELQGVFESFDGSMLCSMVLGVIDDDSGLLYYINVEHPWGVLYRGGKATFFEKEQMFRKLGIPGLTGQVSVLTLQLEADDVLIVGSDGRDDLLLGIGEAGERIINEDETRFLTVVEAADGHLPQIVSHLTEIGELTDDLSLLRVAYRAPRETLLADEKTAEVRQMIEEARHAMEQNRPEDARQPIEAALAIDPQNLIAIRLGARLHLAQKQYEQALSHVEDYIHLRPADTEMIYLAAYLCKKLRRLPEAAEFSERVRLRDPDFVRNLVTLGEVYLAMGNMQRSAKMLDAALALEKSGKVADRARRLLDRARGKKAPGS